MEVFVEYKTDVDVVPPSQPLKVKCSSRSCGYVRYRFMSRQDLLCAQEL